MKIIKILLIIIIILLIIFGIKISGLFNDKEEMTLEQVKEIVAKSENIKNYIYKTNYEGKEIAKKYKKDKEYLYANQIKYYTDYEKGETIGINEEKKIAVKMNTMSEELIKSHREQFSKLLENCEKYEFKGEEIFNGYNCIVVDIEYKYYAEGWLGKDLEKYNDKNIKTSVWIDKETGVIMKISSEIEDIKTKEEYYYEFNCVTDEDVNIPDLAGYEIIEGN